MGKTKDKRLVAVNCTIPEEDLNLANDLGLTTVKGNKIVNTSHGFRQVFRKVRRLGDALLLLEYIKELLTVEKPGVVKRLITPEENKLPANEKVRLAVRRISIFMNEAKIEDARIEGAKIKTSKKRA